MRRSLVTVLAACATAVSAAPATAAVRFFSYDPADADTRHAAGALTFQFDQTLVSTRLLSVRATEAAATADLKPADERALGPGGLARLIGSGSPERALYEVLPADQGAAFAAALCPGSSRAWLATGKPRFGGDLRVFVLGDDPGHGPVRLCRTLQFTFHGEWRLPPGASLSPPPIAPPKFPQ